MRDNNDDVIRYYNATESRWGYQLLLGGTKHFGYYNAGDPAWRFSSAMRRMEDRLGEELGLPAGSRVLDAGAGMGDVARHLAGVFGLNISGVDLLDFNVEEANRRARRSGLEDRLAFRLGDYSQLEFDDMTFDGLYTMETLVHAADSPRTLREFRRVLKPGGRIVLFEYARAPEASISESASRAFRTVNEVAAMPSFQKFEYGVLEQEMAEAGFTEITVTDITHHMLPMLRAFSLLGAIPYAVAHATHKEHKAINSMSAVEFWRHRDDFRYNIYSAIR